MKANSRRKYFSLQSFHHQVYIAQKDTKTLHIFGISLTPRVIGNLLNVWRVKSLTSVNSLDLDWLLHCLLQYSLFDVWSKVRGLTSLGSWLTPTFFARILNLSSWLEVLHLFVSSAPCWLPHSWQLSPRPPRSLRSRLWGRRHRLTWSQTQSLESYSLHDMRWHQNKQDCRPEVK